MLVKMQYNATVLYRHPEGMAFDERLIDTEKLWINDVYLSYAVLLASNLYAQCNIDFGATEQLQLIFVDKGQGPVHWQPVDNIEQASSALGRAAPEDKAARKLALYELVEQVFPEQIAVPFAKPVGAPCRV